MKLKIYSTLLLSLFVLIAHAQTLVNRDWSQVTGYLNVDYDFQTSSRDASGNLIVIGNSYNVGEAENFLITKYTPAGVLVWQKEFNGTTNKTDFGTDVACIGNYIYVSGVSWDTVAGVSSVVTLQLDNNGTKLWAKAYRGAFSGYNFPTKIVTDNSGNVFVAGTSQTAANDYAMVTLKYNTSGTLLWTNVYDSVGFSDGAGGIRYNPTTNALTVYGASGSTTSNWDFILQNINPSTGASLDRSRVKNINAYFAKPTDIVKDANDFIYATGTITTGANNSDIKVIKLDTFLNVVWTRTIDGGASKNDEATAMKLDSKGNILITGSATKADNTKEAWLLKLNNAGTTLWDRRRPSTVAGKDAQNKEVDVDKNGNIYTAGKVHNGSNFDFLTQAYDSSGTLKWEKTYTTDTTTDDEAQDISVDTLGGVTVSGRNKVGNVWRYTTVKYKQWTKAISYENDTSGKRYSYANQLMVKFNSSLVNKSFVNNKELQYTTLDLILPDSTIVLLSNMVGLDLHKIIAEKVVKRITTSDTISITRDKITTLKVPTFWSTFLLHFTNTNASRTLSSIQDSFNSNPKIVFNASKNILFKTASSTPNDPYYHNGVGAYGDQYKSLCDPIQSINYCPLYNNAGGTATNTFRVGVYDSGIKWDHEDLYDGTNAKGYYGYDYVNSSNSSSNSNNDVTGHGTAVAGILGAISNNGVGSTGVAGGDGTNGNGCMLYNMKVLVSSDSLIPMANLFDALIEGATKTPSGSFGAGLDVANMSIITSTLLPNSSDIQFLRDGLRWLYTNGTSIVCAAGNTPNQSYYPGAIIPFNWVTNVAGSNNLGNLSDSSSSGVSVDVIAPSQAEQFVPLSITANKYKNLLGDTSFFGGTSYAAPLVSGVAVDLMSLIWDLTFDQSVMRGFYLDPDDIQNLLRNYARNHSNPTASSGHGLINAGEILKHILTPKYELLHKRIRALAKDTLSIQRNVNLKLLFPYEITASNILLPKGSYKGDVYKMGGNSIPLNIPANRNIIGKWVRNWGSELWGAPSGSGSIIPEPDATIVTINNSVGNFYGYTYFIKEDSAGNPINKWIPYNALADTGDIYFTLHLDNTSIAGIEEQEVSNDVSIYPNPTKSAFYINFKGQSTETVKVEMVDITGKRVLSKEIINPSNLEQINLNVLQSGIYIIHLQFNNHSSYRKIVIE